jgi:hypothetical protein
MISVVLTSDAVVDGGGEESVELWPETPKRIVKSKIVQARGFLMFGAVKNG